MEQQLSVLSVPADTLTVSTVIVKVVIALLTAASSLARPVLSPDAAHPVSESLTYFPALYKENIIHITKRTTGKMNCGLS